MSRHRGKGRAKRGHRTTSRNHLIPASDVIDRCRKGQLGMTTNPLTGPAVFLNPERHAYLVLGWDTVPVITWAARYETADEAARIHGGTVVAVPILADYRVLTSEPAPVPEQPPVSEPAERAQGRAAVPELPQRQPGYALGKRAGNGHPNGWTADRPDTVGVTTIRWAEGTPPEVKTAFQGGDDHELDEWDRERALDRAARDAAVLGAVPGVDGVAGLLSPGELTDAILMQQVQPDGNRPLAWSWRPDGAVCDLCGARIQTHQGYLVCSGCRRVTQGVLVQG